MREPLEGECLDPTATWTLAEVCARCGVDEAIVVELVEHGTVAPLGAPSAWRFTAVMVTRLRRGLRLRQDLGINAPGVSLALELLDEIERLRRGG